MSKLIRTPHLTQLQLVYNTEGLLICQLCDMGVQMDSIHAHVTTANLTLKHAKCDNHERGCPKNITEIVVGELKELLGIENIPVLSKPHTKRSPIEGLKVIEDLFICDFDHCSSGFSSAGALRNHRSTHHQGAISRPKRGANRTGNCQTLYINPPSYFEVDLTPLSTSHSTSGSTFDLNTFLHNRKTLMLHDQHPKTFPTHLQLIPPVFVELGFYTFIKSLDQNSISGYKKHGKHSPFSLLRRLAVESFEEDCVHLGPAHNSIREGIMEAPP